jgi:hypothetical protein
MPVAPAAQLGPWRDPPVPPGTAYVEPNLPRDSAQGGCNSSSVLHNNIMVAAAAEDTNAKGPRIRS